MDGVHQIMDNENEKNYLLKLTSPNHRDLCIASAPPRCLQERMTFPRNPLTCLAATDSCPSIAFPSTFPKPAQRKGCLFSIFSTNPLSTSTRIFTWHRGWEMMLSTKGTMLLANDVTRRTCLTNVDLWLRSCWNHQLPMDIGLPAGPVHRLWSKPQRCTVEVEWSRYEPSEKGLKNTEMSPPKGQNKTCLSQCFCLAFEETNQPTLHKAPLPSHLPWLPLPLQSPAGHGIPQSIGYHPSHSLQREQLSCQLNQGRIARIHQRGEDSKYKNQKKNMLIAFDIIDRYTWQSGFDESTLQMALQLEPQNTCSILFHPIGWE